MAELNTQSDNKTRGLLVYEAPITSGVVLNMVDNSGNLIIFNESGNWLNSAGNQMVDDTVAYFVFEGAAWGSNFTTSYLLGLRATAEKDFSLHIIRSD